MTQPEEPESERVWQPTWVSSDDLTFLGPVDVDDADYEAEFPENASLDVGAGEDHD
jgi:hypothetical protein